MKYSNDRDLYLKVFTEIAKLHDDVDYRKKHNALTFHIKGARAKQYPAVTVGAMYDQFREFGNHHSPAYKKGLHDEVVGEFHKKLYCDVNGNTPFCQNAVGHCAENYAASKVLKQVGVYQATLPPLSDIHFSYAFRPRIWKKVEWCKNCVTMFS